MVAAAAPTTSVPQINGPALAKEFTAVEQNLMAGKDTFTLTNDAGQAVTYTRKSVQGEHQSPFQNTKHFREIVVHEEVKGQPGSGETVQYDLGSADGVDNLLNIATTADKGGAKHNVTITYPWGEPIPGENNGFPPAS